MQYIVPYKNIANQGTAKESWLARAMMEGKSLVK